MYRIIGLINKRIEIGIDKSNENIFIKASSNCITFADKEMECLMAVLTILHNIPLEQAIAFLDRHSIKLFEPAPPAAEITL